MKISVDQSKCQGHAMCFAQAPEVYPLDDLGYTALNGQIDVPDEVEQAARRGARACPEQAIAIVEAGS